MRRLPIVVVVLALTACGGSSKHAATTTTAPAKPSVQVLYESSGWRVALPGGKPVVQRLVGSVWKSTGAGGVKITILSPKPNTTSAPIPQVAAEFDARTPMVEAGIWLDGIELPVNGGGSAKHHTFYGAPVSSLPKGRQSVIAYARTKTGGVAVKWLFTVK